MKIEAFLQLEEERPVEHVFEFLWWQDVAALRRVNKRANEVSKRPTIAHSMFQKLLNISYRSNSEETEVEVYYGNEDTWALLARRLSSWPKSADIASLTLVPRNVRIVTSPRITRIQEHSNGVANNSIYSNRESLDADCCVVYEGRKKESHKGSAVVTSDDHFPCLPGAFTKPQPTTEEKLEKWERLPLVEMQKKKKEGVVSRTMAPFTRICRVNAPTSKLHAYLSCIAYFEVDVLQNLGYSAMDEFRRFSIGLACSLFPLRKKQLGSDQHSFGYHREGSLMHGCRKFAQMPPYSPGDTIGCGLVYPPLTDGPIGKIFFTKNGQLVGMFDMGVESLLSLPWFPAMGLAPSIPMEFNFGVQRNFVFNLSQFESNCIDEVFPGCSWECYQSLIAEQEMNLRPTKYAMHPLYFDYTAAEKMAMLRSLAAATASGAGAGGHLSPTGKTSSGSGGSKRRQGAAEQVTPRRAAGMGIGAGALATRSATHSLYLDNDLRSATYLGLKDTKRVTFQGSDASWEGSAEGEEDEGDDEEEDDTASEGGHNAGSDSDSMQVSGGGDSSSSRRKQGSSGSGRASGGKRNVSTTAVTSSSSTSSSGGGSSSSSTSGGNNRGTSSRGRRVARQPRGQLVSVLRNTGSGDTGAVAMDSVMMPAEAVNDLYPGAASEKTGLRRGSGAIARGEHNSISVYPYGAAPAPVTTNGAGGMMNMFQHTPHYDASGSATSDGDATAREGHHDTDRDRGPRADDGVSMINVLELESRMRQIADPYGSNELGGETSSGNGWLGVGNMSVSGSASVSGSGVNLSRSISYGSSGSSGSSVSEGPSASDGTGNKRKKSKQYADLRSQEQIRALEASYGYDQPPGVGGEEDSSEDSIATSMFVEVASVDEDGSYVGYGGDTPNESDIDEGDGDSILTGPGTGASAPTSATGREGDCSFSMGSSDFQDEDTFYRSSGPRLSHSRSFTPPGGLGSGESSYDDFSAPPGLFGSANAGAGNGAGVATSSSAGAGAGANTSAHTHAGAGVPRQATTGLLGNSTPASAILRHSSGGTGSLSGSGHKHSHSQGEEGTGNYHQRPPHSPHTVSVREDGYDGASEMGANNEDVDMADEETSQGPPTPYLGGTAADSFTARERAELAIATEKASNSTARAGSLLASRSLLGVAERNGLGLGSAGPSSTAPSPRSVHSFESSGQSYGYGNGNGSGSGQRSGTLFSGSPITGTGTGTGTGTAPGSGSGIADALAPTGVLSLGGQLGSPTSSSGHELGTFSEGRANKSPLRGGQCVRGRSAKRRRTKL